MQQSTLTLVALSTPDVEHGCYSLAYIICFAQLSVSENAYFASESEWKKFREETFEGSEWVLPFHLS